MSYNVVRLSDLMAYEFGQVEGDFDSLRESDLKTALPAGMSFRQLQAELKSGELVLLHDTPSEPLMIPAQDEMNHQSWQINPLVADQLEPLAQKAYLERVALSEKGAGSHVAGGGSGSGYSGSLHPAQPMPPYVPEPTIPDNADQVPASKYEYMLEIACSDESRLSMLRYGFVLQGKKAEVKTGPQQKDRTEHGTRYVYRAAYNEQKRLYAFSDSAPLGVSLPDPVRVKPIGSAMVRDAYIPIQPVVQVGGRLGFPASGYLYHFRDNKLVQEFYLPEDGEGLFYATLSREGVLNTARGCPCSHRALLVFWKINGVEINHQSLVYLKQPITLEQLNNLDDTIAQHGIHLDIRALLDAIRQPVMSRESAEQKQVQPEEPTTHTVQRAPGSNKRESWPEIAQQYGLSAKELLNLNPAYHADPMTLKIGDVLNIRAEQESAVVPERISAMPPQSPQDYNQPLNSWYRYQEKYLTDTQVIAIHDQSLVTADIPLVRITDEPVAFDLGFSMVEKRQSQASLWNDLLADETAPQVRSMLQQLNGHLNDPVRPGELVILASQEPQSDQAQQKLKVLQEEAKIASEAIGELSDEQAELNHRYFETLDCKVCEAFEQGAPSDAFAWSSAATGTLAPAMQKHLENVATTLQKLDGLYIRFLGKHIGRDAFIQQRQALTGLLDSQLDKLTQKTLSLPVNTGLKEKLGIHSTKSLIHHADEILEGGRVPELGRHLANTSKWVKYAENAGKVSIGLSIASATYSVTQQCEAGGLSDCARATTVETGGVIGGWAGGYAGAVISGAVVTALSLTSAPVILIVVGSSALVGGILGAGQGKEWADNVYDRMKLSDFFNKVDSTIKNDIPNEVEKYINENRFNNFDIPNVFQ
ncbi:MIX and LysM peptidoglycan-binding domain-containing protein [Vibrio sp. MEBiC08052]|uniref:MIX and LysM peptidoglycan-binding domain-containing protein n=1 Tax=Vibrio sp. MEBiC08052 TaxID=1761910 RepID=UPI000A91D301|nr:LysM peptidoglycan-binding domain-containing protein [Vibrio sp. MEBiC08052]